MKKKITWKGVGQMLLHTLKGFNDNKVLKLSGALAYFTVFSMGPMMMVIIFFADVFYGREAIEGTIYQQLSGFVGPAAASQIQEVIRNATLSGQSTLTAILGFTTLLIGATTVFSEIQDSINMIWNLRPKPKKGWLKILMNRLISFSVVVGLGFILLVSLVVNGIIEGLMDNLQQQFPQLTIILIYILNLLITFIIITVLFAIIYKVLPDARIKWKDVMIGSMFTALLFMLGKFGVSFYIGSSDIGSTYGTAGSLVVLLLWVYYSSVLLYFGAEFTKSWALMYGTRIYPSQYAVWVKHVEVEEDHRTLKQLEKEKDDENKKSDGSVKVT